MPDPALLTPTTLRRLAEIPVWMRGDSTVQAILYAQSVEDDLLNSRVDAVRDRLPAKADDYAMRSWEQVLQITIGGPPGATLEDRRVLVEAGLAKLRASATGADWVATLTKRIGPGWSYVEHDHDDPTGPPPDTIWVFVPFAPDTADYSALEDYIRDITPAKDDIVLISTGGFLLDISQLDQEGMAF